MSKRESCQEGSISSGAWDWGRAPLFQMSGPLSPLSPGLWDDREYGKPLMKEDHPANTTTEQTVPAPIL